MINKLKEKLSNEVKENEILAQYTTFKIGGPAKYFYVTTNSEELLKAVKAAEDLNIPYFILGRGSNVLVSDDGFPGLVIKAMSENFEVRGEEIWVEAGFSLNRLIGVATQSSLSGLETFLGIPGTVGGAARGNAGAYGISFSQKVLELEIYKEGKIKKFSQKDMKYAYRDSILKREPGVILSVILKLTKSDPKEVAKKVAEIAKQRKQKLPGQPSAGCVFKNCELANLKIDEERIIKELDITKEEWRQIIKNGKIPVGYLIDRLNLKGKTIGGAQTSLQHGGFIINTGKARAEQVMMLISDIKMRVRNQLGIQLQEEIQYVGF